MFSPVEVTVIELYVDIRNRIGAVASSESVGLGSNPGQYGLVGGIGTWGNLEKANWKPSRDHEPKRRR